jgi:O-antigen/teichoic acid export membrane protein
MLSIFKYFRNRLSHRPNLVRVLENIGWLLFDKTIRIAFGLLILILTARYLGPDQFGQLNYATSFVAIFASFAAVGLQAVVVRELINEPANAPEILGTAFLIQIGGSIFSFISMLVCLSWFGPDDQILKTLVIIIGFSLSLQSGSIIKYWFESQTASRYAIWAEISVFIFICSIKISLVLFNAPLEAFAFTLLLESVLVFVALLAVYKVRVASIFSWSVTYHRFNRLLSASVPLMLSNVAVVIYMRLDQVMLGQIVGASAVGIYSAAVRVSEVWHLLPVAIVASLFPAIILIKQCSERNFHERIQWMFDLLVVLSIGIAAVTTLLADWLVLTLFGQDYGDAVTVLILHAWAGVFVFLGIGGVNWYIIEDLQKQILYRTLTGALISVLLNLVLIPRYGSVGAAISTFASQVVAAYLMDASSQKTRPLFVLKSRALFGGFYRVISRFSTFRP